jgi:hypothetical protein
VLQIIKQVLAGLVAGVICIFLVRSSFLRPAPPPTRPVTILTQQESLNEETRRKLEMMLPEVRFDQTPFVAALARLGELAEINIVGQDRLEAAGFDPQTPLTITIRNQTAGQALATLLKCIPDPVERFTWWLDGGLVRIGKASSASRIEVRLYDVRNIIADGVERLAQMRTPTPDSSFRHLSMDHLAGNEFLELLKQSVDRESWVAHGGSPSDLRLAFGKLIVHQYPENHEKIGQILRQIESEGASWWKRQDGSSHPTR